MSSPDYQFNYTESEVAKQHMYDKQERVVKADKILRVLQDYLGDLSMLNVLEMSCSAGLMTEVFSEAFDKITAIDIDAAAIEYANNKNTQKNVKFIKVDALNTYFSNGVYDVIICNQMYEHVPSAEKLMNEIFRLLVPGGVCYFSATNRLKVIETHYGRIPFLSYLPKKAAHLYLRILGKGRYYYETHYTYWGLKTLVKKFVLVDYTSNIVRNPKKYNAMDVVKPDSIQQRLTLIFLRMAYVLCPGYIWLLKKPGGIDAAKR
ncbi:MAG: class I SAM-dependent methyltransferase [Thiohalomonadales bacterium]